MGRLDIEHKLTAAKDAPMHVQMPRRAPVVPI
jgi:hypothetical protein